jgi:O-antigen ligase
VEHRGRPEIGALAIGLTAIGLAIASQLVPLSHATLARVSPGADAFLRQYDLSYVVAQAGDQNIAAGREQAASARHPLTLSSDKTLVGLALFAAFAVFLAGTTRLLSARGASAMVRPIVIFGVALALFGIMQSTLWGDRQIYLLKIYGFWEPRYRGNPFGPFVNRNHFAGWMIMVLPLALAGGYAAWERGKATHAAGFHGRLSWLSSPSAAGTLLMTFAALVMGLSLLMSQSRSGMAGFAAGTLIFAWIVIRHQESRQARVAAAAVMSVVLIGAAAWAGLDRIAQRVSSVPGDISTAGGRLQAWSDTTHIIRDFPATGTGLNTYGTAMILYQTGDRRLHFQEAHNDYLQLAAESGLLVGLPIVFTLAFFIRDVRRRFKEAPREGTTYWFRVGAVVGLVSIAIQALLDFSLQMPGNAALFAVLAAVALHQSPNLRETSRAQHVASY